MTYGIQIQQVIYDFLLAVCSNNDSYLAPRHERIYSVRDWLWPWEVLHFRKDR